MNAVFIMRRSCRGRQTAWDKFDGALFASWLLHQIRGLTPRGSPCHLVTPRPMLSRSSPFAPRVTIAAVAVRSVSTLRPCIRHDRRALLFGNLFSADIPRRESHVGNAISHSRTRFKPTPVFCVLELPDRGNRAAEGHIIRRFRDLDESNTNHRTRTNSVSRGRLK